MLSRLNLYVKDMRYILPDEQEGDDTMKIRNFGVEIWMNRFEMRCELNLAETCVASLTIDELLTIAGKTGADITSRSLSKSRSIMWVVLHAH